MSNLSQNAEGSSQKIDSKSRPTAVKKGLNVLIIGALSYLSVIGSPVARADVTSPNDIDCSEQGYLSADGNDVSVIRKDQIGKTVTLFARLIHPNPLNGINKTNDYAKTPAGYFYVVDDNGIRTRVIPADEPVNPNGTFQLTMTAQTEFTQTGRIVGEKVMYNSDLCPVVDATGKMAEAKVLKVRSELFFALIRKQ